MNEKGYEDGTKAAKTPIMVYYAELNDNILGIHRWQNEHQRSVNDFWSCIMGNLSGYWLQPFMNELLAGLIGRRESDSLPAPFC